MKSLALHLITILLLASWHISSNCNKHFSILLMVATASASSSSLSPSSVATVQQQTTTLQPPSLHAAHRVLPVTTTTTITTTASPEAASIRQQQQQKPKQLAARRSSPSSLAHANPIMASNSIPDIIETTTFASTRLVRNANANITNGNSSSGNSSSSSKSRSISSTSNGNVNSVRQHRSLQSAISSERNSNNNNNNSIHKSKQLARRHHFRMNQSSASTTTTTTTTPSTASATSGPVVSSSRSFAHEHQTMSTFMAANHRRSKQQQHSQPSMPLVDGVKLAAVESSSLPAAINNTATTKLQQTPKTPRMIQRLVAGHIQNAEGRSTYQVSAVTTNSTVSNSSTTLKSEPLYYRRNEPVSSSSYRHVAKDGSTTARPVLSDAATTTSKPLRLQSIHSDDSIDDDDRDDDEALLDDPGDFDSWDNGILRLSAGAGKESQSANLKKSKDDSKKTLSDQVRDGKYGLIEKEIFRRPPKRPGVLSYLPNKEVPYDNERNYGGLNEEDIWLAEDHLLVIKGGSLNEDERNEPWSPIDDYDAPGRQIKIPPNPKVPPPFPVQLEENGPVQFIGNNKFTVVYPIANESIPIYPAGPEANYSPAESDRDDEKNLLARPGSAQDAAEGEPGYLYPAPYPPWLYHNQTFVNPFLSNARPITFPGLGPFPFGRNGSLETANVTDYFDEDDPSLYYPPAYSFVYKSNYTNPVPPGPLVPGIVLPPPANQFSRLQKSEKHVASTTASPPPARHRVHTTTSTTTTTSTPSTTTQLPYRQQVITRITEYTPKTIIITPAPLPAISSSTPPPTSTTKLPPTPPPTPSFSRTPSPPPPPSIIESVPVPVAIPIPFYPSNKYHTSRPNIVSFVPTTPEPERSSTLSQSNPIYYEYFEAKRQPAVTPAPNVIDDFLSTTQKPTAATPIKPIKLYATSKRPFKSQHSHRNYLHPVPPNRQFVPENIVYITPKPEIRYKRPQAAAVPPPPIFKQRPLENFEREVNAIRETLRYYQNQQLRDNNIPRTAKAKPIYEYTFDATKNLEPVQPTVSPGNFQPPTEFDIEPFKPMVTYSPPVDDDNAFRAIAVDKLDGEVPAQQQYQPKYQSTTTLIPVQPEATYQATPQSRSKKLRVGAKYLQQQQQPLVAEYREQPAAPRQQQQQPEIQYQTTPRTILTTQLPWLSLDKQQQEFNDYAPQPQQQQLQPHAEQLQLPPQAKHRGGFPGYYYAPPPPPRQNNRFYDEPFQNSPPVRKIVNYRPQHQPQHQQQQQHQQQPNVWSLENDTYVNFAPNRPPLNPDAEFINPYQTIPVNTYANQGQRYPQPPPISHQSQYYAPPQRLPPPQRQYQPLHRDILVNYRQPLPPINPDSEYISHPQIVRNQANQIYRSNAYRLPPQQQQQQQQQTHQSSANNGGDDAHLYYITPKYRRSSGSNHNQNNNSNNDNSRNNNNNGK